ncbi:tryptophan-rich sensory protein [Candidatus Roizmanbacteria bacterium]|nr:tryptophan-rich sensory protein [Candidatus Roizmanbacteria bacterium]
MRFLASILLPQLSGFVGSYFTVQAIPTWYMSLNKPSFSPPNWLFGPIWVILYLLMGIALYLNWSKNTKQAKFNVQLFFIHLFFNLIWAPVFFGLKDIFLALEIIIFLWAMIIVMIDKFWKVSRISSLLLVPYLLWVAYASLLNYFLWKLN